MDEDRISEIVLDKEQERNAARKSRLLSKRQTVLESPFARFEDGQILPVDIAKDIPYSLLGRPLAESDKKTFVVLGRELALPTPFEGSSQLSLKLFRFSSEPSFFLFSLGSFLRRLAIYCYTHPVFEAVILLTICGNAVFMSLNIDCPVAEYTFLAIYTWEAATKMVARGVFYPCHTYLRDAWNWVDLFVLLSSYVALAVQVSGTTDMGLNLQALRTFRLLRMITILPGLQSIVKALLLALRKLVGVLTFVSFFLVVFALFGIELFQGDLRNKCVANIEPFSSNGTTWSDWVSNSSNWGIDDLGNFVICGNISGSQKCHSGFKCLLVADSPNPFYGFLSFDNFIMAILTVIALMTGDYWEEVFRAVLSSQGPWSSLYFFIVVIFGAFYLMNLILSVVALSYTPDTPDKSDNDKSKTKSVENDSIKSENQVTTIKVAAVVEVAPGIGRKRCNEKCTGHFRRVKMAVRSMRPKIRRFVDSSMFDAVITVVIIINTLAMAVVHHGMPQFVSDATDMTNNVCAVIFAIEAVLKIVALGRDYFRNRWNLLDFFVVLGSVVDAVATYALHSSTSLNTTSIRLLRLLRILKLAQSWRTMRLLLEIIFYAVTSLANLTVILACIVFIFSLIGMQLFSQNYTEKQFGDGIPRWNFDDFFRSLMTVFRILCRDAVEPMVACFRANGMAVCIPVFLGTLVFGTFVALNLFLALLLMAFSSDDLKSSSSSEDANAALSNEAPTDFKTRLTRFLSSCRTNCHKRRNEGDETRQNEHCGRNCSATSLLSSSQERVKAFCEHKAFEVAILVLIFVSSICLCLNDVYLQEGSTLDTALSILDYIFLALFTLEFLLKLFAYGFRACFTQFWTLLDFVVITTGFIDLGLTNLTNSKSNLIVLRCLRCIRCLRPLRAISRWQGMRIVVDALISTIPGIGNVLLVVVVFWLVFAIVGVQFFAGKFARCVDIASGARLPASIIPDRRTCENFANGTNATRRWANPTIHFDNVVIAYLGLLQIATFESWTDIFEAGVDVPDNLDDQPSREQNFSFAIYFIVFIVFGSFFLLNLFIGVIVDNFNALKKQMEVSTVELLLTDSQRAYYKVVKKIGKLKPRRLASEPKVKFLAFWFNVATSPVFEIAMACVIMASCATMATEHFNQSETFTDVQEKLNIAFTAVFTVEAVVKVIGLRIHYFRDAWNIFDLTLVVWSLATIAVDEGSVMKNVRTSSLLRALRVLRIGRLVRLVRSMSSVRALIFSLLSSLPALFNVGCLLSLIIFIYSICGMILFGHIRHQGAITDVVNFETFGNSFLLLFRLSTLAGWDGVLTALSIQPYHLERGGCNPDSWLNPKTGARMPSFGGDCGNPIVAAIFLVSFIIVSNFVLTNIFVAIILENLEAATQNSKEQANQSDNENALAAISDDDINSFFLVWAVFDPLATQYIPLNALSDLLSELDEPFKFKKPNGSFIALLDVPILSDGVTGDEVVHCGDVLMALVHHRAVGPWAGRSTDQHHQTTSFSHSECIKADSLEDAVKRIEHASKMEEAVITNWQSAVTRNANLRISSTMERRREEASAVTIQRAWRRYRLKRAHAQAPVLALPVM